MTKEVVSGQQIKTVAQSKEKNHAIELLRFFFALFIVGYHTGFIYPSSIGIKAVDWMAGAGEILFVFTLTAGYFLVKHFKRLQANPEYSARSASGRAWEYLWGRCKALLPVLALGILLGVVAVSTWNEYTFSKAVLSVINGLWEFLGLYSAGFNAGLKQANGAMWFISGLLICSYFLYWVLCKREDLLAGFIAPFLFIFCGGWWAYTGTRASQVGFSTFGTQIASSSRAGAGAGAGSIGFNNGLLFVLIGMCGGIIIYYAVEKLKKFNYNVPVRVVLTVVYAICLVTLVIYTINPTWVSGEYQISGINATAVPGTTSFYRWTAHLLCIIVVGLTLLNEDYLTKLLNNKYTAKLFDFLGGMALYIYMLHCPFIFIYPQWRGMSAAKLKAGEVAPYSFWEVYFVVIGISIVLGTVVKFLMDKFVLGKYKKQPVAAVAAPVEDVVAYKVVSKPATKKSAPARKPVAKSKTPAKKPVAKKTTKR